MNEGSKYDYLYESDSITCCGETIERSDKRERFIRAVDNLIKQMQPDNIDPNIRKRTREHDEEYDIRYGLPSRSSRNRVAIESRYSGYDLDAHGLSDSSTERFFEQ